MVGPSFYPGQLRLVSEAGAYSECWKWTVVDTADVAAVAESVAAAAAVAAAVVVVAAGFVVDPNSVSV